MNASNQINDFFFLDSNVVLYGLYSKQDPFKFEIASQFLIKRAKISTQVLSEVMNVLQLKHRVSTQLCAEFLYFLETELTVVPTTGRIIRDALDVRDRFGYSQYDSQIVAAALKEGCSILYSEDMQHGLEVFERTRIINPFEIGG